GAVSDRYDYDAFGVAVQLSGSTPNNYRYDGEQNDFDLGTYYLRARYYDAANGRFRTRDSFDGDLLDPLSLTAYIFGKADPGTNVDPTGDVTLVDAVLGITLYSIIGSTAPVQGAGNSFQLTDTVAQLVGEQAAAVAKNLVEMAIPEVTSDNAKFKN